MKNSGFISLWRDIRKHWVWLDPKHFQMWITILMITEFAAKTRWVKQTQVDLKRGEFSFSLATMAHELKCSKPTAIEFLNALVTDGMLRRRQHPTNKKIYIYTVVNYDKYQQAGMVDEEGYMDGGSPKTEKKPKKAKCPKKTNLKAQPKESGNAEILPETLEKTSKKEDKKEGEKMLKSGEPLTDSFTPINNINKENNNLLLFSYYGGEENFGDGEGASPGADAAEESAGIKTSDSKKPETSPSASPSDKDALRKEKEGGWGRELENSQSAVEGFAMSHRITPERVREFARQFTKESENVHNHSGFDEFRRHFNNWLRLALRREKKEKENNLNNRNHYGNYRNTGAASGATRDARPDPRRGYDVGLHTADDYAEGF